MQSGGISLIKRSVFSICSRTLSRIDSTIVLSGIIVFASALSKICVHEPIPVDNLSSL